MSSGVHTLASSHAISDNNRPGTSKEADMEGNCPGDVGSDTSRKKKGRRKTDNVCEIGVKSNRRTRSSVKQGLVLNENDQVGTSKQDSRPSTSSTRKSHFESGKSTIGTNKLNQNRINGQKNDTDKPERKQLRMSPGGVTTRSSSAKKKQKIYFVSEKDCECDSNIEHDYFTLYGKRIKTCKIGTLLQRYQDQIMTTEYKDLFDVQPFVYKDVEEDYFSCLSVDIMCYIFDHLSIKELLPMESMSRKTQRAVQLSMNLRQDIDFLKNVTGRQAFENNLSTLTDSMLKSLVLKLPKLRNIYNFHPQNLSGRQSRTNNKLSIPGIVDALKGSSTLDGIQISNIQLLEAILTDLKHVRILRSFQNRLRNFPPDISTCISIPEESLITSLHLVGCCISNLPEMNMHLKHLYLRMVKFAHPHPFKDFSAYVLETFVMAHCAGPASSLKYIPLLTALAEAPRLKRLELQRVPFLGGVIQHICEDNWMDWGFRRLTSIIMGMCKNALDADLGFLIIAAAPRLEKLCIQPSLTRDAFFSALAITDVTINPGFEHLSLGWVDSFPDKDEWSNDELVAEGLSDVTEVHSRLSDAGMKLAGQCFPPLQCLEIYNCPHLYNPMLWFTAGLPYFTHVRELILQSCHSLRLDKFCMFIHYLPNLELLTLEEMFKEQPKGCSRVGLSAGTGLGVSNALVTRHEQPAVVMNPGGNQEQQGQAVHINNGNQEQHNHGNSDNSESEEDGNAEDVANQNLPEQNRQAANQNLPEQARQAANQNLPEQDRQAANQNDPTSHNRHSKRQMSRSSQNGNEGYNLRQTSAQRSQSSHAGASSKPERSSDGHSSYNDLDRRKSPRFGNRQSNSIPKDEKPKEKNCDIDQNSEKEASTSSSGNQCVNSMESSGSGHNVVSRKGKALVTKKGLVMRSKSSNGCREEVKLSHPDVSHGTTDGMEGEPEGDCTCVTQTQTVGCQATMEDIKNENNKLKETRKHRKRRKSKRKSKEKDEYRIIVPKPFMRSGSLCGDRSGSVPTLECYIHGTQRGKSPTTHDQCNSTSDPVMEEDHPQVMTVTHQRLQYLCLNFVGVTEVNINCSSLKTLSISRCRVLNKVNLKKAQFLENVHVSQCRKFDEDHLMDNIYRLPCGSSTFVSLRPLHPIKELQLYHNVMFSDEFHDYKYGTVMVFDYSDKPSETNYNKLRAKSWIDLLDKLSVRTMTDFNWPRFLDMENPNKDFNVLDGVSVDGSRWMLNTDLPWIPLLQNCPQMEREYIKNPEWLKEGIYCMEAKGHFSFWDAYGDLQDAIHFIGNDTTGLYDNNVITYVNLCDVDGVPTQDSIPVM